MVNASGKERNLPLKVLGDGDVSMPLKIKAAAFSASAREKLTASGGAAVDAPVREKWSREAAAAKAAAAPPKKAAPKKGGK